MQNEERDTVTGFDDEPTVPNYDRVWLEQTLAEHRTTVRIPVAEAEVLAVTLDVLAERESQDERM